MKFKLSLAAAVFLASSTAYAEPGDASEKTQPKLETAADASVLVRDLQDKIRQARLEQDKLRGTALPDGVADRLSAHRAMTPMNNDQPPADRLVWKHDWELDHASTDTLFGWTMHTAGDINGDDFDDMLVGAPNGDGAAYLFHGSADGPADAANWIEGSPQEDAQFGYALGSAGDIDGDGFDDVVIGAPFYSVNPDEKQGAFYIYRGSSAGLSTEPDREYIGQTVEGQLGLSVASAGDVNGDGYVDVIVGAPGPGAGGTAFIYTGGVNGLSQAPTFTIEAPDNSGQFGFSVDGAGDVNGDGYADVIVGSPAYTAGEPAEGAVFLYLGSENGPSETPDWQVESDSREAFLGYMIAGAGDINGDGYGDIIAGAAGYTGPVGEDEEPLQYEGAVFAYLSDGTTLEATHSWKIEGNRQEAFLGKDVSGGGDVNGDGYDDVLIANAHFGLVSYGGELYLGGENGLSPDIAWQAIFEGNSTIGQTAHMVGDINNDGFTDMLLSAPELTDIYLYFGAGCFDADWDNFTAPNPISCPSGDDCHDLHDTAYPGGEEICDGLDNNCDGTFDDGCDDDGDGYCDDDIEAWAAGGLPPICPNGLGDCDDEDPDHNPGSPELCNFKDDDCNDRVDEEPKVCGEEQICVQGGCFAECTADAECAEGQKCYGGRCAADPCEGIICPETREECFNGTCQVACKIEAECRFDDKQCIAGRCAADPCDGVLCGSNEVCDNGTCVDPNAGGEDAGGDAGGADAGTGSTDGSNKKDDGGCSTTPGGVPGSGMMLVLAALGGLLWRRRS
ncbi:FG-GAP-like repeat-containing protein [Persicimonas caeni]|nr:FG-GAP-like repeat-containing protein [Persicimonas caeni]